MTLDTTILNIAYEEAQKAFQNDEVPVAAVIFNTSTQEIISVASNKTRQQNNSLLHAEICAVFDACEKLNVKRLDGYSIFVTLEPCSMCASALSLSHIDTVYFGAFDTKTGGVCQGAQIYTHPQTHHKPAVTGGIEAEKFAHLLTQFFKQKRSL